MGLAASQLPNRGFLTKFPAPQYLTVAAAPSCLSGFGATSPTSPRPVLHLSVLDP